MGPLEDKESHSHKVKCDCCGAETLAEIRGDKLVIMDRRHGRKHIVVLTLNEIMEKMKGLVTGGIFKDHKLEE